MILELKASMYIYIYIDGLRMKYDLFPCSWPRYLPDTQESWSLPGGVDPEPTAPWKQMMGQHASSFKNAAHNL